MTSRPPGSTVWPRIGTYRRESRSGCSARPLESQGWDKAAKLGGPGAFDPRLGGRAASGRFRDPKTGKIVSYTGYMTDNLDGLDAAVRERYGQDARYVAVYHDVTQGVDTTIPLGVNQRGTVVGTDNPTDLPDARPVTGVYIMPNDWKPPGADIPPAQRVRDVEKMLGQARQLSAQAYATTARAEILSEESESLANRSRQAAAPQPGDAGCATGCPTARFRGTGTPAHNPDRRVARRGKRNAYPWCWPGRRRNESAGTIAHHRQRTGRVAPGIGVW